MYSCNYMAVFNISITKCCLQEAVTCIVLLIIFLLYCFQHKEEVRKHFNCSTLEGAELEDQGSSGTAGSHWEKRVFWVRILYILLQFNNSVLYIELG